MKAIVTVGISASGKTTWANQFAQENGWEIVCRDDSRIAIHEMDNETPFTWKAWDWKKEKEVTERCEWIIDLCSKEGKNLIVADTNLNKHFRENMVQLLEEKGYEVEIKVFDIFLDEAIQRDIHRPFAVGYDVLAKQYETFCREFKKQYVTNPEKPNAILVDIDNTLSEIQTNRSPFDWSRVEEDKPKEAICEIVRKFYPDHKIILLSAREERSREGTVNWLKKNQIRFDKLILKEDKDFRSGYIVKEELFWKHVADNYNVVFALEDNRKVIMMYHSIGVNVLSVGNTLAKNEKKLRD